MTRASNSLLRVRGGHQDNKVTFVELFFDLVFVYAVTQLSHHLLHHLTTLGAIETALLMMAVWWVWIYTSWVTNWLNPDRTPVRLMLFVLMLAGLVLSTSLPEAFGERGLPFALAYVFMQVGRSLFTCWAFKGQSQAGVRNFQRITIWLSTAGALWIAGAFVGDWFRLGLWGAALFIEYLSPIAGFWVPRLGRSTTADWDVEGGHMAERCALFIIIALGESILVTGVSFTKLEWSLATLAAFAVAFVGSVAMWWIYFHIGATRGSRHIVKSRDPGRLARFAYTYVHLILVAGIIVAAVGDELILAHPLGELDGKTTALLLGGPALFLIGNLLFKRVSADRPPLSHLVGLGLLGLLIPVSFVLPPLALAALATATLIIVAAWESISLGPQSSAAHEG